MPTLDSPTLDTVFFDYDRKPLSRHPMTCLAIYGKGGIEIGRASCRERV